MKLLQRIALFLLALNSFTASYGQTGKETLRKYQATITAINTVSYNVQRIDTFPSGAVWNHRGSGIMQRDAESKLLQARFLGSRFDVRRSYLYDGTVGLALDDSTKTYQLQQDPYLPGVLGSPGGQMLVEELLLVDPSYQKTTYSRSPQGLTIMFHYPDQPKVDVRDRYTYLVINEKTGLPEIVKTTEQRASGKMITTKILSDLRVNNPADASALDSKTVFATYSAAPPATPVVAPTLLGKPAPDFRLIGFDQKPVTLSSYRGKVVLLDMWTTSCSPCIAAMPALQQLQDKYHQQGLRVVSVLMDPGNATRAPGHFAAARHRLSERKR